MSSQQMFKSGQAHGQGQAEAEQLVQSAKDTAGSVRDMASDSMQSTKESQQHAAGFLQQTGAQVKQMAQDAAGAVRNAVGMGNTNAGSTTGAASTGRTGSTTTTSPADLM